MAFRSLTEVFTLMRNNALQNRHIFAEPHSSDDRTALVSRNGDPEIGVAWTRGSVLPPEWVDGVEEVQFELSKIHLKMKELTSLHDKHVNRPTLDDSTGEQRQIEMQTQEITQSFTRCQRLVQQMNAKSRQGSPQECKLTANVVASLARTLQDLSANFRKSQSGYLKKFQSREERSKLYFGDNDMMVGGDTYGIMDDGGESYFEKGLTFTQAQFVEDNSLVIKQREKEVLQIVQSINELNEIFKDLAQIVVEQGTILDRIDYNIEQTSTNVEQGLKQLQKAEKHQKKNRKMLVIVVLFVVVLIMIVILIALHS